MKTDVAIIGGGVIGTFIARELSRYKLAILLIEKEADVAMGTSKGNSGIIHAGYNADHATLKGRLNVKSNFIFDNLCRNLKIPFKRIGSMVIGFNEEDLKKLKKLKENGIKNGVQKLDIITGNTLFELEPNLNPLAKYALFAPSAAVISPYELTIALADNAIINGVNIFLENEVKNVVCKDGQISGLLTSRGFIKTKFVINAAGLYADEIAEKIGDEFKIQPLKGEYQMFDKQWSTKVNHVLFPIPTHLSKGILVTPTLHGNLLIGPNSYWANDKNDTATTQKGMDEVYQGAKRLISELPTKDKIITSFTGLRANTLKKDFIIEASKQIKGFINVAGIQSPGLSAAPAIAEMVVSILCDMTKEVQPGLNISLQNNFIESLPEKQFLSTYIDRIGEWKKIIKKDMNYGEVICRCEKVTKAEILRAIRSPLPAKNMDAIKRRVRAGMGRCQGGFCGPKVLKILADELNASPLKITKKGKRSEILRSRIKEMIKE